MGTEALDAYTLKIAIAVLGALWVLLVGLVFAIGNRIFNALERLADEQSAQCARLSAIEAVNEYKRGESDDG